MNRKEEFFSNETEIKKNVRLEQDQSDPKVSVGRCYSPLNIKKELSELSEMWLRKHCSLEMKIEMEKNLQTTNLKL